MKTQDLPLINNKHIKNLELRTDLKTNEILLLRLGQNCLETKIQQVCHNMFLAKYMDKSAEFVQIDNGGKMGFTQKRKKKAEGTKAGFPDVMLIRKNKVAFVEFKRIGTPSQIDVREDQIKYMNWLNNNNYKAYITNNPIYFQEVILKEFEQD